MEHPKLRDSEIEIVQRLSNELRRELQAAVPACRWSTVALAVVVELAGDALEMLPGDTEQPPALCNKYTAGNMEGVRVRVHCSLQDGHEPPCDFGAAS